MRRVHLLIGGLVQGVGFRYTMQHVAQDAGVSGWVRNLRDGRVEAEVEGTPDQVDTVLAWAARGPRGGHVDSVTTDDLAPQGSAGFEVRHDG